MKEIPYIQMRRVNDTGVLCQYMLSASDVISVTSLAELYNPKAGETNLLSKLTLVPLQTIHLSTSYLHNSKYPSLRHNPSHSPKIMVHVSPHNLYINSPTLILKASTHSSCHALKIPAKSQSRKLTPSTHVQSSPSHNATRTVSPQCKTHTTPTRAYPLPTKRNSHRHT
jgi:hypothetical protein